MKCVWYNVSAAFWQKMVRFTIFFKPMLVLFRATPQVGNPPGAQGAKRKYAVKNNQNNGNAFWKVWLVPNGEQQWQQYETGINAGGEYAVIK